MSSLDKVDMSLDDIIKLNRKKHVQTPNKVKEFRGRVGKKKIQGISPLNRRGLKNANQKARRGAQNFNSQTTFSGKTQQYNQGNVRSLRSRPNLTQAKRSLLAAKKTLAKVERQLNSKMNRDAMYNQRRNLPVQQVPKTQQRRKLNRNFNSRQQTGYMRSDNRREWGKRTSSDDSIMKVSIYNGKQSKDVAVTLSKATTRRLSEQSVTSQRGRGANTMGKRGRGINTRGQRGRGINTRGQRGRGVSRRGQKGGQRQADLVVLNNQQQKRNRRIQRKQKNAVKFQNQFMEQANEAMYFSTKTAVPLSDRFSQIQPRRGRGGNRRGRGGRGYVSNQGQRQVFL